MKSYKLLFLAICSILAVSCSKDTFEHQPTDTVSDRLASDEFDNSYKGLYKGLFTTNDGLTRGSVEIRITPSNEGLASITLSSGEVIELVSNRVKLTVDQQINNLHFSSEGLSSTIASLNFSVNSDGTNSLVNNVSFDNKNSDILIAKNLSRAPLTPITGTFDCTNCEELGIGFPSVRTWNVMSIGEGNNQNFLVQVAYHDRVYTSPAENNTQNGCQAVPGNPDYTFCGVAGSITILTHEVTWNGTHLYANGDDLACSSVSGSWSAPSYGPGIMGTFQSDEDCSNPVPIGGPENDLCANAEAVACGSSVSGTTTDATDTGSPDFCAEDLFGGVASAGTLGVWYSVTTTEDQIVTIDTNGSTGMTDTQLRVFSGTCGSLVCIGSNDDDGDGLLSSITFNSTANETYLVFVAGYQNQVGDFTLNVTCEDPAPALTCGAIVTDNGGAAGNYANNSYDVYVIDAGAGNTVSLNFSEFNLENTWDYLQVYDGADTSADEITMSVGGATTVDYTEDDPEAHGFTGDGTLAGDSVVSTGQYLTLVFYSDISNTESGFSALVECVAGRSGMGLQKSSLSYKPVMSRQSARGTKVITKEILALD